jgi:hypothetical protein
MGGTNSDRGGGVGMWDGSSTGLHHRPRSRLLSRPFEKFLPIDGTVPMLANVTWEYDPIKGAGPSDFGEISQGLANLRPCPIVI